MQDQQARIDIYRPAPVTTRKLRHILPLYHADLNPVDLIWDILKGYIARINTDFKTAGLEQLIKEEFARIVTEE